MSGGEQGGYVFQGLSISYRRLLADMTGGIVVVLVILAAVRIPVEFWSNVPAVAALFLAAFLMSAPLGVLTNAVGWFTLGWIQMGVERSLVWAAYASKDGNRFAKLMGGILHPIWSPTVALHDLSDQVSNWGLRDWKSWARLASRAEHLLEIKRPQIHERLGYLGGLRILACNFSLLSIGILLLSQTGTFPEPVLSELPGPMPLFLASLALIALSGMVSFFYSSKLLNLTLAMVKAGDLREDWMK